MIDKNGAWVTGNGILDAEGVKRDPITNKMFRDMNRRSAGLVPGQFDPLMSDKPDSGAPILLNPSDSIDAELLHPLVQVDDANKPIMKDGKPVALDRATELSRALAGLTAVEVMRRKRAENYAPEKGEAHVDDEGQFQPGWLSNDVLTEMFAKNKYNPEQKRIIREVNKLIRKGAGDRVVMINFPATTRNKAGKVVYKPQGATLRDTVPVAVTISKDGNLLFGLMSVTKLHENIQKRSQDRRGKKLYGGNVDLILRDTQAMMDYHKQGLDSIEFFKQKYGAVEADERKKFINTMFGLLNQKEQAVLNPMLLEDGIKSKDNVYRTYRADRVSKAVLMAPEEYAAMPFSYEAVSQVRMPEAQRAMPEPQKSVALRTNQAQERPVNERQPTTIQTQPSGASVSGSEATGEGLRQQGGLFRGTEQLQPQGRPGDQSIPLAGLPATVTVPGIGKYTFGPNETARSIAADYARSVGIDYNPPRTYAKVDEARATRIADEYEKMVHAPNDPRVKESYDAMIKETIDQWEMIKKTGLVVEPIPAGAKDPYAASPRLAVIDVKDNNHLWFFPTNSGFGGTESAGVDVSGNPLMNPTGEILNGHTMLANDVFRIVHDYFGHIKEGVGFRADGEENAWRSHSAMYSDKARPAMTAETRGQNSWVNFGPFAEFNKTATGADTQYAPQKTGLLPDWVMTEGASDARLMPEGDGLPVKEPTEISKGTKDALPVIQAVDDKGELKFKDGKPVPQIIPYNFLKSPKLVEYDKNNPTDKTKPNYAELAYDIPKSAQKKIDQAIDSGAVDAVVGDVVKRTKKYLENPEIAAGMGWYSRMRVKLVNALGEKGREILSQLLGATSARTPVRENFLQAMDAHEGINAGRYEPNRKAYIDMLQLEESGTLADEIVNRGYLDILRSKINDIEEKAKSLKGQDQSNLLEEAKNLKILINQKPESWKPSQRAKIMILATDMLPKRSNGKKFNANSLAVLKVIHGSWLDNRKAPKTPNFAGNLSGRTLQATIDVWAARFLRAVLYEGKKTPWRIQPKAESAVTNEDFAIGQIIFERSAKKLKMNPDDLQAVLWFAEKDRWDKMGWTQKIGAEKSSFDDIFSIFFPDKQKPLSFEEASAKLASEGYAESAQNLDQETEDNE
jgi:hypothetical protein